MPLAALLRVYSAGEWRQHPWRHATAVLAVLLGVALSFAVHLINQSALSEFSAAVRSVNGQPDLELRGAAGDLDEDLYARVAAHPTVEHASPVIEAGTLARRPGGERQRLRLLGVDALAAGPLAPALVPRLADGQDRLDLFANDAISLNAAAQQALGVAPGETVEVQVGLQWRRLRVVGSVSAAGTPVGVMDIGAAQWLLGRLGRLSRLDLRFVPGTDPAQALAALDLPADVRAAEPDAATQRVSNVSRAYRVNLTVLSLVALFTGGFLVFSVLSLSVARRQQQLALLGVLGLAAHERLKLVLAEAALVGLLGSTLGLAAGTALAALALRLLGGDLGGGYFPGVAPSLQFSATAALAYGALGLLAALAGGWVPARAAQAIAPAQALKGLGGRLSAANRRGLGAALLATGVVLALLPPVAGMPVFAYLSVAALLIGGIACVPDAVALLLRLWPAPRSAQALLALERARRMRHTATVAVAGVVASLSLAVALTVMVASFRDSVSRWLDAVLPADLYVRTSAGATADAVHLPPEMVQAATALPGVARVEALRVTTLALDPARPGVALIARPLDQPERRLPLAGELRPAPPGALAVFVSEAMVDLYGARPGTVLALPLVPGRPPVTAHVRGVWRDYARQHGSVVLDHDDFVRLTGDRRVNELALWLADDADLAAVQAGLRALADDPALLDFASVGEIRARSLQIFDRSFAVTYWLQAVAIGIGLFGVAASFSAQVLARRKEFGLLRHLGFTRAQVLAVVAGEGAAWTAVGALLGVTLGLAVSVVLVHVVNPQSFHWSMDLLLPWARLLALAAAVVVAGTVTACLAGRAAASPSAVLAVKEDW
ncbi:ABC transporter permease [Caldimonas thermodepolymerans]|uniref:ABC transporter permease n=2 Tax=Caldimonas thermodepolymerans TaxID=215580 RepID=A0A2S5T2L1_9BURK|nr:ABC transporter permease [Caldimonas thermodepolymerans]QPC33364.1 ABC transporter permease [Caldimonas thermodepolymerans]